MTTERQDTFSDKLIPYYFAAFFVGLAILFAWFTHLARSSYTGVATDQAYERGIAYNDTIARANAQEALGWDGSIVVQGANDITLKLTDADGHAVTDAHAVLWLFRPVQRRFDMHIEMQESSSGTYSAQFDLPQPGLWEARIFVKKDGIEYQTTKRMVFQ